MTTNLNSGKMICNWRNAAEYGCWGRLLRRAAFQETSPVYFCSGGAGSAGLGVQNCSENNFCWSAAWTAGCALFRLSSFQLWKNADMQMFNFSEQPFQRFVCASDFQNSKWCNMMFFMWLATFCGYGSLMVVLPSRVALGGRYDSSSL